MTGGRELQARIRDFFTFSRQELIAIFIAALATALIFSFRDWGEDFFDATLDRYKTAFYEANSLKHSGKDEEEIWQSLDFSKTRTLLV